GVGLFTSRREQGRFVDRQRAAVEQPVALAQHGDLARLPAPDGAYERLMIGKAVPFGSRSLAQLPSHRVDVPAAGFPLRTDQHGPLGKPRASSRHLTSVHTPTPQRPAAFRLSLPPASRSPRRGSRTRGVSAAAPDCRPPRPPTPALYWSPCAFGRARERIVLLGRARSGGFATTPGRWAMRVTSPGVRSCWPVCGGISWKTPS